MLMLSSLLTSREDRLEPLSLRLLGSGGGDELVPLFRFPGGVTERLDLRELRELREGVRYGVSAGVGSDPTGPVDSSSVSHTAIMGGFSSRALIYEICRFTSSQYPDPKAV